MQQEGRANSGLSSDMAAKVFVDGQAGTTGLQILDRLAHRADVELLSIAEDRRKDHEERRRLINLAEFVFLCLPDDAAKESVSFVNPGNAATRIIDASTAHRTDPGWSYGIPELSAQHRARIRTASRVAVPGCHASGFNLAVYPLVRSGIISQDYPLTCTSLSGYSGAGKQAIASYEDPANADRVRGSKPYALSLWHKHLPEMQATNELTAPPVFLPVICNFYSGMIVSVPLVARLMAKAASAAEVRHVLADYYSGERFVEVMPYEATPSVDGGLLDPTALNGTNRAQIFVFGNSDRLMVSVRFDNLGKGASGAAVQCLNIMLGVDEATGLE